MWQTAAPSAQAESHAFANRVTLEKEGRAKGGRIGLAFRQRLARLGR